MKNYNKTFMGLVMQYGRPAVPLSTVCVDYFNIAKKTAEQKTKTGLFPVPVMRVGEGQKAPYMIRLEDLAEYLDALAKDAIYNHVA